jgi:hypothetical protein
VFYVCSFCGLGPAVAWFDGPSFLRVVQSPDQVRSQEAWVACGVCLRLVESDDREGLVDREVARQRRRDKRDGRTRDPHEWPAIRTVARDQLDRGFWGPRSIAAAEPHA